MIFCYYDISLVLIGSIVVELEEFRILLLFPEIDEKLVFGMYIYNSKLINYIIKLLIKAEISYYIIHFTIQYKIYYDIQNTTTKNSRKNFTIF